MIPTAEEQADKMRNNLNSKFLYNNPEWIDRNPITEGLIEFAKLHCTEQVKEIIENVKMYDANENCTYKDEEGNFPDDYRIDKNSILNAYSLDNIK